MTSPRPDRRIPRRRATRHAAGCGSSQHSRSATGLPARCIACQRRLVEQRADRPGEAWYATYFHELVHATGHSSRLDRGLDRNLAPFGSPDYGKEELVAEMGAAFLCGHAGITPATVESSAAYVQGWLRTIRGQPKLVVQAAGAAQRAAELVRCAAEHSKH